MKYEATPGFLIGQRGCNIEQVKYVSGKCVDMEIVADDGKSCVSFCGPLYNIEQAMAEFDRIIAENNSRKDYRKQKRQEKEENIQEQERCLRDSYAKGRRWCCEDSFAALSTPPKSYAFKIFKLGKSLLSKKE